MKRAEVAQAVRKHHPLDVFHFVSRLPKMVRLYVGLLRDSRVTLGPKLLMLAAVVYCFSPMDFLPDVFPVLTQVDDLALFAMAARAFLGLCPAEVVSEHEMRIDAKNVETLPTRN
jgi:uncharacterized membrane protein YkvA (DUF1232 family)